MAEKKREEANHKSVILIILVMSFFVLTGLVSAYYNIGIVDKDGAIGNKRQNDIIFSDPYGWVKENMVDNRKLPVYDDKLINEIIPTLKKKMEYDENAVVQQDKDTKEDNDNEVDNSDKNKGEKKETQEKKQAVKDKNNQEKLASRGQIKSENKTENKTEQNSSKQSETEANTKVNTKVDFNKLVLDIIKTYNNGSYPYILNEDYNNYNGVTTNLYYKDKILLKAHPSGNKASHCVGITFEVFFKAMQKRNKKLGLSPDDFNGLSWEQLYDFAMLWYAAKPKTHLVDALEKYGLGKRITKFENAKPGDFMQFYRENLTGHTVVFLEWVKDEGKIVGFKYWSSQESTKGISYKTEYFNIRDSNNKKYGNVIIDPIHIGRVTP